MTVKQMVLDLRSGSYVSNSQGMGMFIVSIVSLRITHQVSAYLMQGWHALWWLSFPGMPGMHARPHETRDSPAPAPENRSMSYGVPLEHYPGFTISLARQQRIAGADLDRLDYSSPEAVQAARLAITRMTLWDRFIDRALRRGSKRAALDAIASKVLCEQAAVWHIRNPAFQPVGGLSETMRLRAQVTLLDLLSPRGVHAVLSRCETVSDGLRFSPDTGSRVADDLLRMVIPHWMAASLWQRDGKTQQVAGALKREAQAWEAMGLSQRSTRAWSRAASLWETLAETWHALGETGREAYAWRQEALCWRRAKCPESTARSHERESIAWQEAGRSDLATLALDKEAAAWRELDRHDLAAAALAQKAAIMVLAGQPDKVTEALRESADARDRCEPSGRAGQDS